MTTTENATAPIQDCPIQAVFSFATYDCSFPRDHTGPHSWQYPNLYPRPSSEELS